MRASQEHLQKLLRFLESQSPEEQMFADSLARWSGRGTKNSPMTSTRRPTSSTSTKPCPFTEQFPLED